MTRLVSCCHQHPANQARQDLERSAARGLVELFPEARCEALPERTLRWIGRVEKCQSAVNFDPRSASNIDPGGGSSTESTGRTRASWSDRRESDGAMRGGLPVGPRGRAGGSQARFLKRQLSFPVSTISQ